MTMAIDKPGKNNCFARQGSEMTASQNAKAAGSRAAAPKVCVSHATGDKKVMDLSKLLNRKDKRAKFQQTGQLAVSRYG
jgi:hypothetical protein